MALNDWFTVQLFLSDEGACEVLGHADDYRKLRCTCSAYGPVAKCKHVKFMRKFMDDNGGMMTLKIPEDATDDEIEFGMSSAEEFRKLVIKYGKIEYLP